MVIDPIGIALIFYSLSLGQTFKQRAKTIVTGMFIALCIIVAFALLGERLLTALGIEMDALRIEIEDELQDAARVADALRIGLGLKIEVNCVDSLPRFEAKGRRFVDQR